MVYFRITTCWQLTEVCRAAPVVVHTHSTPVRSSNEIQKMVFGQPIDHHIDGYSLVAVKGLFGARRLLHPTALVMQPDYPPLHVEYGRPG